MINVTTLALMAHAGVPPSEDTDTSGRSRARQLLGLPVLHMVSIFALIYVGIEVTLGGVFILSSCLVQASALILVLLIYLHRAQCLHLHGHRLDCYLHYPGEGRRSISWLHLLWLLWRPRSWTYFAHWPQPPRRRASCHVHIRARSYWVHPLHFQFDTPFSGSSQTPVPDLNLPSGWCPRSSATRSPFRLSDYC
jgi:hypothetical protein